MDPQDRRGGLSSLLAVHCPYIQNPRQYGPYFKSQITMVPFPSSPGTSSVITSTQYMISSYSFAHRPNYLWRHLRYRYLQVTFSHEILHLNYLLQSLQNIFSTCLFWTNSNNFLIPSSRFWTINEPQSFFQLRPRANNASFRLEAILRNTFPIALETQRSPRKNWASSHQPKIQFVMKTR